MLLSWGRGKKRGEGERRGGGAGLERRQTTQVHAYACMYMVGKRGKGEKGLVHVDLTRLHFASVRRLCPPRPEHHPPSTLHPVPCRSQPGIPYHQHRNCEQAHSPSPRSKARLARLARRLPAKVSRPRTRPELRSGRHEARGGTAPASDSLSTPSRGRMSTGRCPRGTVAVNTFEACLCRV